MCNYGFSYARDRLQCLVSVRVIFITCSFLCFTGSIIYDIASLGMCVCTCTYHTILNIHTYIHTHSITSNVNNIGILKYLHSYLLIIVTIIHNVNYFMNDNYLALCAMNESILHSPITYLTTYIQHSYNIYKLIYLFIPGNLKNTQTCLERNSYNMYVSRNYCK